MKTTTTEATTYFKTRMNDLGITDEINEVNLWENEDKIESGITKSGMALKPVTVFTGTDKGIKILVYTLDRERIRITKEGGRMKDDWHILRLEKPDSKGNKYIMPKGHGSFPFFPPSLVDKYDNEEEIPVLYLTEGFFKAFKGSMHGIDIVGLASITHLKNKENGALHDDILKLIKTCSVKRVVWLTDGDCLDISSKANDPKEEVDLYERPSQFYQSIATFKQLLDDYDVDKYFFHVDTYAIWNDNKDPFAKVLSSIGQLPESPGIKREDVKGLDDILIAFPDKIAEIVDDLQSVSRPGYWFQKFNITTGYSKVRNHFRLHNVTEFILFHYEKGDFQKNTDFIWHGSKYHYNEEKGECDIVIKGDPKLYFRVGNDYYKWVDLPNQYNQLEKVFLDRSKGTITDDHGRDFTKHVPKFEAFCNVPSHTNYQQHINNCFNVYSQIDHLPDDDNTCTEKNFEVIHSFLLHLFGRNIIHWTNPDTKENITYETIDLALDYLQILYQKPQNKLPILCLVSKENNTGKSTFANFLRMMLGANVAIVGNQDLAGDFNAHWSTKSVVICDETKIDKQHVVEKIKSLSTAKKIWMNAKGKGQVELDCFIKFVLISNNEDNFIYAGEEDIRYWVIKAPKLEKENPDILENFVEEMPKFLSFLSNRKLKTEKRNRMWFHPDLIKTDALSKVIQASWPSLKKSLVHMFQQKFEEFDLKELRMSLKDITSAVNEIARSKYEQTYVRKILVDDLKMPIVDKRERYTFPLWEDGFVRVDPDSDTNLEMVKEQIRVDKSGNSFPYIITRDKIFMEVISQTEEASETVSEALPLAEKPDDLPF